MLAVLPFEHITRDGKPGYFGAGMTEEVMNQLSKVNALRVVSRAAVAKFTDVRTDLAAMTSELGIGSVVTGSVREDAGRVRVNVELVDARSGQQLWSEQYDRDTADVFAVQSDIALRVADALKASVTLDEQARLGKRPTTSVAAYELLVRSRTPPPGPTRARLQAQIDLLQQAVKVDPQFALAYAQLANRYSFVAAYGDPSGIARGLDAANKAIALDPQLAQGHFGLASNLGNSGRSREALKAYRRAAELDPSFFAAFTDLAVTEGDVGRFDEALISSKRGLQLAPNVPVAYYHVALPMLFLDDDARTERFLTNAASRFPAVAASADSPGDSGLASRAPGGGARSDPPCGGRRAGQYRRTHASLRARDADGRSRRAASDAGVARRFGRGERANHWAQLQVAARLSPAHGWTDGRCRGDDGRDPEGEPEGDRRRHGMGDPLLAERRHPRAAWRVGGGAGLAGTCLRRRMA